VQSVGFPKALGGAVIALAVVAAVISIGVAVHELQYAGDHPYAYGPAKVIAWGAGAGALLALAVALLAFGLIRAERA
jgi:Mn2+/Fe2+ NRAMP family transporter